MIEKKRNWYAQWFNETYLKVYAHRDEELAESEVRFVIRVLGLDPRDRVLDLCSGAGRHILHLQKAGFRNVVGLDLSPSLLAAAGEQLDSPASLIRGDMRRLPFGLTFDAVLSLFTSFGYFPDDEENLEVLKEVRRVLKPGGKVFLDLLSPAAIHRLVPESERLVDGMRVRERRSYDTQRKRVEKEIEIDTPEGRQGFFESVRIYSFGELSRMLAFAGLSLESMFGDFHANPYTPTCERMIVVGTRLTAPPNLAR